MDRIVATAKLVHFVNQNERIFRADLLECLDRLAWHGADIRPAMSLNFSDVT